MEIGVNSSIILMSGIKSSKTQTLNYKDYSFLRIPSTDATSSDNSILPTDLSNLKAWWDVSSIPDVLDGTTITILPDLSGNGFNLTSQVGTTVIKRGVAQGKDALRFTGSQRFSCANVLNSKTELTMFIVWKPMSTVTNILFEQGVSHLSLERTGNLDALFYVGQVGGAAGAAAGIQGTLQYNSLTVSSGGLRNFKNGAAGARVTHTGNTGTDTFNLGARSSNSFFTTADISEFIIYDRMLSTEERILVEQYIHRKYNFSPVALFPSTVPVRARWSPESMSISGSTFDWRDVSGNAHHATKTGTIPSITTGLNGLSAVQGTNGSDRRLLVTGGSTTLLASMPTMAILAIFQTPATPENLHSLFGGSRFGSPDAAGFSTDMFNLELTSASYPCTTNFRFGTHARRKADNSTLYNGEVDVATSTVTASQWCAYWLEYDGNNIRINLNGVWTAGAEQTGTIMKPSSFYLLGTHYSSGFYWGGKVHEIVFFSRIPNSTERTEIFDYVRTAYGLSL